ncbi:MAG TPA: sigma-70 family RNA polymerase sigma factor [Verrucomicrobiae bacterium]|jgi:RNA polymerase sigma factor (sigma-70 family)
MQALNDIELLRQYAGQNSETAFAELVKRHVPLVYSAALRKTGNPSAAEEVTQAVFVILARKAGSLRKQTVLSGWLYQTARLTAANFLRAEIRRAHREQEAFMESLSNEMTPEAWPQIMPLLEDAMGRLGEKDRNAIVLRFFEGKSFQEIGATVGASENAAKKRVVHALEKLRKTFLKQGVNSTTEIIAGAISANSIQTVPAALAKSVATVALAKSAAASTSTLTLIKGALKIMVWSKAKTVLVTGVVILLGAGAATVAVKEIQMPKAMSPLPISGDNRIATTALVVASEFVQVPDDSLGSLDLAWRTADSSGTTAILTREQHTNLIAQLKLNQQVKIFGAPGLAFPPTPGQRHEGTVSMTKPLKVAGTNTETGVTLGVAALISGDSKSVNLNLATEWRGMDDSQNEIISIKGTNSATLDLESGQTILVRQPMDGNRSTSLLIFVTPQVKHVTERLQRIVPRHATN